MTALLNGPTVAASLNGVTVTGGAGGNSGGGTSAFFDTVQIGASASVIFDNTHVFHDVEAIRFATGASAVQANVQWQGQIVVAAATMWFRLYLFTPSSFTNLPTVCRMLDATNTTQCARFAWDATGHLLIRDTGNTQRAISTNALSTSTAYRVEGFCAVGAAGTAEVKFWSSVDSAGSPVETVTAAAQNYSTNNVGTVIFGQVAATANIPNWWGGEFGVNDVAYLGPWQPSVPQATARHGIYPGPRRGQRMTVTPPAQVAPPGQRHPVRRVPPPRIRPRAATVPIAQVVPPPPTPPPSPTARVRRVLPLLGRRRPATVPLAQGMPPVPQVRRRAWPVAARGHRALVPTPRPSVPAPPVSRRRLLPPRRTHVAAVPLPQVVVVAPAARPQPLHRRLLGALFGRRGVAQVPVVAAVEMCETPRPATGTTARPGSGTTAYATATTGRPSTGVTARPNTGTTSDPC